MELKKIILKPGKDKSLRRFHPWVFSGALKIINEGTKEGDVVEVFSNKEKYLGTGHYQEGSITIRLFEFIQQKIDLEYWTKKIMKAIYLRKSLSFIDNKETNIYRLIHAEGDDLPGLIIDYYNGTAVIQCHSIGMWLLKETFCEVLRSKMKNLVAIYDKSAETLAPKHVELHAIKNQFLFGEENAIFEGLEYNNKFSINWLTGQKTGFFLDQRENRKLLGEISNGKKILNIKNYKILYEI